MPVQVRILVADDHPVVRIGVRHLLQSEASFTIVGESTDGRDILDLVRRLQPDVLLLDLAMPGSSGLDVLRQLRCEPASPRAILLTAAIEQWQLVEALELGARAVVMKDAAARDLIEAIHAVSDGQYWINQRSTGNLVDMLLRRAELGAQHNQFGLSTRELQVISAVVGGCTNKDIAQTLSICEDTVKRHLTNIFDKVGVSNRLELGLFAVHHKLVPSPDLACQTTVLPLSCDSAPTM